MRVVNNWLVGYACLLRRQKDIFEYVNVFCAYFMVLRFRLLAKVVIELFILNILIFILGGEYVWFQNRIFGNA